MLVAPPLVQRGVINMISFKLQCSNKLRDSSRSSNCQYEIHQCRLQRICVEMSSQTSLSRNKLLIPGHIHATMWLMILTSSDFSSFLEIFFTSTVICQKKKKKTPLKLHLAGYLQTTHVPEVSFYCCLLISGNRCRQYEIVVLRLALTELCTWVKSHIWTHLCMHYQWTNVLLIVATTQRGQIHLDCLIC